MERGIGTQVKRNHFWKSRFGDYMIKYNNYKGKIKLAQKSIMKIQEIMNTRINSYIENT